MIVLEVPAVAFLARRAQKIQLVIAQNALGQSAIDQFTDPLQHRHAVGAAIAEIADEHQSATGGMPAALVVAKVGQQMPKCIDFAVNVADDVERAFDEVLDGSASSCPGVVVFHESLLSHHRDRCSRCLPVPIPIAQAFDVGAYPRR